LADSVAAANNKAVVFQGRTPMPWSGTGFAQRHNKSLRGAAAVKVGEIANAIMRGTGDDGEAARIANSTIKRMKSRGTISDRAEQRARARRQPKPSAGLDSDRDVDAATT
jgi:hypothetical protein